MRLPTDTRSSCAVLSNAINATLYDKLNFNFIRDIAPVAGVIRGPYVMVVNPSVPAKTVPEFIAYAKANPRKLNMASAGTGTGRHIAGELFKMMAGVDMVHVPYRGGGPALTDLLGGQVQVMFPTTVASIEYIRAGRLRALAVTTATRSDALPDIPTVGEFVPGYEASNWYGVGAPKATPAEIVEKLNKEINAGLADPKIKARLADLGGTVLALLARRLWQADRRRNREVGQGDQVRGHQSGSDLSSSRHSINPDTRMLVTTSATGQSLQIGERRKSLDVRCSPKATQSQRSSRSGPGAARREQLPDRTGRHAHEGARVGVALDLAGIHALD